jgi:hypothetical protein
MQVAPFVGARRTRYIASVDGTSKRLLRGPRLRPFPKFCSHSPYNAKLCLNGHEYVKRQLEQKGIAYESLDNGIVSCQQPQRLQSLCNELFAEKIDTLPRKWFARRHTLSQTETTKQDTARISPFCKSNSL